MNIKIAYSPYTLKPQSTLNAVTSAESREGMLLKVQWPDDNRIGYADLHPWPELGDASLEAQMSDLRLGKMSPQIEQSVWLADRDAKLRLENKNIFDQGTTVKNNYIVTDFTVATDEYLNQLISDSFSTLKIKVGRNLKAEAAFVCRAAALGFRLRLDFNGAGSPESFRHFVFELDPRTRTCIEYVEDPMPFDEKHWQEARKILPLALDNQFSRVDWGNLRQAPFDVLVIKPAKMDIPRALQLCQLFGLKATVTSYMDHPVGMMHALGVAMSLKKDHPEMLNEAGCMTHLIFQQEAFAAEIPTMGPFITRNSGKGIGFDTLLESQKWYQVKTL